MYSKCIDVGGNIGMFFRKCDTLNNNKGATMNLFNLAEYKVQIFDKVSTSKSDYFDKVIDTAIKIRHALDIQARNKKVAQSRYGK